MNVLFLEQFGDLGGAQFCLLDLMLALLGRGWKPRVLLPAPGRLADRLHALGVETALMPYGPYRAGRKSAGDIARFGRDWAGQLRAIRRRDFELLYVNGPRLLAAAAAAARGRAPVVFHAHNYLGPGPARQLTGWSIRAAHATVIACSRSVAGPLEPYAGGRLHVIANGTPDMLFRHRSFDPARLRIGILGKLCPQKGQADFLRAARLVAAARPLSRFVVCGDGDDAELRSMSHGLAVEFLGWRDNIATVLSELDVLVIASRQEGLPRVMLEAFSAGIPVVAYPAGGIPEAIEDGATGFLAPEFSPESLAARILAAAEELPAVACRARQLWEARYSLTNYRERILDLMQASASGRPARASRAALPERTA